MPLDSRPNVHQLPYGIGLFPQWNFNEFLPSAAQTEHNSIIIPCTNNRKLYCACYTHPQIDDETGQALVVKRDTNGIDNFAGRRKHETNHEGYLLAITHWPNIFYKKTETTNFLHSRLRLG